MSFGAPVYWINLARSHERRLRMERRLRDWPATRVEAVDARDEEALTRAVKWSGEPARGLRRAITPIEAAVVASHLRAIKHAYDDGAAQALIVEDDVTFDLCARWPNGWTTITSALPRDYGIAQLSVAALPSQLDELFRRPDPFVRTDGKTYSSAAAYLIERRAMRCLIEAHDRGDHFDISDVSVPAEMVLFGGVVAEDPSFVGPLTSRIPLFSYEGHDSDIALDHNDFLRPSRAYLLAHYDALVTGRYGKQPSLWARSRAAWRRLTVPLQPTYVHPGALADTDVQHVRHGRLERFVHDVLPTLRRRFVLLTDGVALVRPSDVPVARDAILQHPLCGGWLATHRDDARMTPFPLGMRYAPGESFEAREQEWRSLLRSTLPLAERLREPLIESPFERSEAWSERMLRFGRHAVVVAPQVHFDSHEVWHALFMGCIVVVPREARILFADDLPIFAVDDIAALNTNEVGTLMARYEPAHAEAVTSALSLASWRRYCAKRLHSQPQTPGLLSLSAT